MTDPGVSSQRTLIANVTMSIDGRAAGQDGDMSWLFEHAVHEQMAAHFAALWGGASTALMGRTNYEGFRGYWPAVARDPDASQRDRDFAQWLDGVEKVVISRTLREASWENTRIAQDLEAEVRDLKAAAGRDILVLSSLSLIQALLSAELVDELRIYLCPELLGAGQRLFEDGLPRSSWQLAGSTTTATGAIVLQYSVDRSGRDRRVS